MMTDEFILTVRVAVHSSFEFMCAIQDGFFWKQMASKNHLMSL